MTSRSETSAIEREVAAPEPEPKHVHSPRVDERGPSAAGAAPPSPPTAATPVRPPSTHAVLQPAEALSTIESFRRAYAERDVAGVMALMAETPRDRQVTGRVSVKALYEKHLASLKSIRYDLADLAVHAGDGADVLRVRGRYHIQASRTGWFRPGLDVTGPIEWTLRAENGGLRIVAIDYAVAGR